MSFTSGGFPLPRGTAVSPLPAASGAMTLAGAHYEGELTGAATWSFAPLSHGTAWVKDGATNIALSADATWDDAAPTSDQAHIMWAPVGATDHVLFVVWQGDAE